MRIPSPSDPADSIAGGGGSPPLKDRCDALAFRIEQFRERLAHFEGDQASPQFLELMQVLLQFLGGYDDPEAYAVFEQTDAFPGLREFFAPCVLKFTWAMEKLTHQEITHGDHGHPARVDSLLGEKTRGAYERMKDVLKLADLSNCRRYLMMGCGIVPGSLFYLHDWTAIEQLVGVERDSKAHRMARDLVARLGLSRIEIVRGDAATMDYGGYDVIYWDPFAIPRREIMERIGESADRPSTIVLRDPFFTGTILFEPMIDALDPRFEVVAESERFPGRFILKHYILRLDR